MSTTEIKPPITITTEALDALKQIIREQDIPADHGLRIGVKGGGCSGLSYILGFDVPKENDESFEIDGIRVLMNQAHGMYLVGMEIGYHVGLNNRGFLFNNPTAQETCGCGSSFSA